MCIGAATKDLIYALPRHPDPDDRVVATAFVEGFGGPAATAAVTLARLGVTTTFIGSVGDDAAGAEIRADLARSGVDVSELRTVAGAASAQSVVLVEGPRRAIVTMPGPPLELSPEAQRRCRAAAWVHVDHAGYALAPRETPLSVDAGNAIEGFSAAGVALYAPTEASLRAAFGSEPEAALHAALEAGARVVVATRGGEPTLVATRDETFAVPTFPIADGSTLGAGDVFHGALLAALVRGAPLALAVESANACAALSCRALDSRSALPTAEDLDAFLASAGRSQ